MSETLAPANENFLANPIKVPSRMTMIVMCHHEQCCDGVETVDMRWSQVLKSEEQTYVRRFKIDSVGKYIDLGWLSESGIATVVVSNTTNKRPGIKKETLENHVLLLSLGKDGSPWRLRAGRAFPGEAVDPKSIYLKAESEPVDVSIMVIPE